MTSRQLAGALEVSVRTILRDVDALTESGLPVVVHRGVHGGIELGFDYRTRLTGLAADEAEALGVVLGAGASALRDLGMEVAGQRACDKLVESLPDTVRERVQQSRERFGSVADEVDPDPRVPALAAAVRVRRIVRIHARSEHPRVIHPIGLRLRGGTWCVDDARTGDVLPVAALGDLNISSKTFAEGASSPERKASAKAPSKHGRPTAT